MANRTALAAARHAAGASADAETLFADAEARQAARQPNLPQLYSLQGFRYCDLLLDRGQWRDARDRAAQALAWYEQYQGVAILTIGLDTLTLGRAALGAALTGASHPDPLPATLDTAVDKLNAAGAQHHVPRVYLARAAYFRYAGDWDAARRDLDEARAIAEPGPMGLFLCDEALERARLAFAHSAAHAPLAPTIAPPAAPDPATADALRREAADAIAEADKDLHACGYHHRDDEFEELKAIQAGTRSIADLPPRV